MAYRSGVAVICGVGRRCGLDLVLLWLWGRLAAVAPIWPLGWEPPYAAGVALKRQKKKKKKEEYYWVRDKDSNWNQFHPVLTNLENSGLKMYLCFLGGCSKREIHSSCVFITQCKFNHGKLSQHARNHQWLPISTFISSLTSQMGLFLIICPNGTMDFFREHITASFQHLL